MSFPSDNDVQRLIDIQSVDCGFFVLAVYAFIEQYMKSEVKYFSGSEETNDTFNELIWQYENTLKKQLGWLPKQDHDFLFNMKNGKHCANLVRHQFQALSVEEARAAIRDLLRFCELSDAHLRSKFKPLEKQLVEWETRISPQETAKELYEANKKISEMREKLPILIKESQEYQELKGQLEKIKQRCILIENEKNISEENAKRLEKEMKELEQKQLETQNRFGKYEDYISNLKRMLAYTRTRNDFERSILKLTAEQQDAIEKIKFNKDYLINGSAGTGKSLVLLKSVEKLIKENEDYIPQILFVTFTNSLVKYNTYIAKLMKMGIDEENIKTADSFFKEILEYTFPKHYINYNDICNANYKKTIREIISNEYSETSIDENNVFNEAISFIWSNMVTKEEYLVQKIDRTGMKFPLKLEERKIYWEIIEKLEKKLDNEKSWHPEYAKFRVARSLQDYPLSENDKFADYIFVDEAQDLSISAMYCLKSVCNSSVVMAADKAQTIYQIQMPMIRSGINVSGNSITLKTNFRNTMQISDVAENYRKYIKGFTDEINPSSFRMGPPVELVDLDSKNTSVHDMFKLVAQRVKFCINELEYAPENICVVISDIRDNKPQKIIEELSKIGIVAEGIKNKNYDVGGKVCISTIQSCKGLDFPVVILLADCIIHFNDSKYDTETIERLQRNMFYVAMTRAMDMLTIITWNNSSSEVINDIKKCVVNSK